MGKCEDAIVEKEKDVAYLKYNLNELKKSFNEKDEEVDLLKIKNSKIEEELKMAKERNQDLKNYEIKTENLMLKNQLLENKVYSIENQLLILKKQLQDQQVEITSVKQEVEDVRSNLSEDIKFHLSKPLNDFQFCANNDVKKLKDEVNNVNNQINTTHNEVNKLSVQSTTVDERIQYIFSTLNDKISKGAEGANLENDPQKEIDNLKQHVNNIENILFCDSSDGCKDVLLKWKLPNYQYHFDIGKPVFSPIFLTQIKGYCFKLGVKWSGEKKENLGLGLKVCRGSNYDKPLEPFKMPYSLEMVDNKGNILSKKISLAQIETFREESFTLLPGENECERGYGYDFLSMPDVNNYILNDMLSIQCRLKLHS